MPNLACGCVPSPVCSVCVCLNAGIIASSWVWHCRPMLHLWGPQHGCDDRWVCPLSGVTLDPARCLSGRGRRSKVRVNETDQTTPVEKR